MFGNRWTGSFKPLVDMAVRDALMVSACRLLGYVLILGVVVFVLRAATALVISDAWFYVYTLIRPWQEGHLSWADFFIKRGPSDHTNPLYRLILLMHTAWFHMDFTVEGLIGVCFAVACVYLWCRVVRKALAGTRPADMMAEVIALGLTAVVFSLNARGVYGWPLVTLSFIAIFAVSVLCAVVPNVMKTRRFGMLALATIAVFFVDDTYGVLAVASIVVLLSSLWLRGSLDSGIWWRGTLVLLGVAAAYLLTCRMLVPYFGSNHPGPGLKPVISLFEMHWRESWKLIAIPAWSIVITPEKLVKIFHATHGVAVSIPVVVAGLVCAGHVWFWRNWLRREPDTLSFLAAGLMLFFYFALAAFVVARLPRFGFDYLYQPRYVQIYDLQLIAMLMMSARVLSECPGARLHRRLQVAATAVLVVLAGCYAVMAFREIPFIRAYQVKVAAQIEQLANDPDAPPSGCLANLVPPCSHWSLAGRVAVLDTLERGPYNLFSPTFRKRHRHQVPASWNVPIQSH